MVEAGRPARMPRRSTLRKCCQSGAARSGVQHPKLREVLHKDFTDYPRSNRSSRAMTPAFIASGLLHRHGPGALPPFDLRPHDGCSLRTRWCGSTPAWSSPMSRAATDSTEQGSLRWARVKGKTENDLLKLPFKAAYMFRPSGIQPLRTCARRRPGSTWSYAITGPLLTWMVHAASR